MLPNLASLGFSHWFPKSLHHDVFPATCKLSPRQFFESQSVAPLERHSPLELHHRDVQGPPLMLPADFPVALLLSLPEWLLSNETRQIQARDR